MKDEIVKFETAKLAKEKKFEWNTYAYYVAAGILMKTQYYSNTANNTLEEGEWMDGENYFYCSAPTQAALHRWLREVHGQYAVIIPTITANWTYKTMRVIGEIDNDVIIGIKSVSDLPPYKQVCGEDFNTYEDALEAGLVEALKLIK